MISTRSAHRTLPLPDGRIVLQGEVIPPTSGTNLVEAFNPATRSFQSVGILKVPRWQDGSSVLLDGRILIVGGRTNPATSTITAAAEIFDPIAGSSTVINNLNQARFYPKAITLQDGRVLIAGGTGTTPVPPLPAELFDPVTGLFTTGSTMRVSRPFSADNANATVLHDGRVLFFGGSTPASQTSEIFNPATGTFDWTGTMLAQRAFATGTLLPDGRVVIIGGSSILPVSGFPSQVEVFDPATGTFSALGSIIQPRRNHSATLLPDGKILITGGWLPTTTGPMVSTASVEIFDPATGISEQVGNLATRRADHRAAALATGQILVTGGRTDTPFLRSAEIFDPLLFMRPEDLYAFYQEFANLTLENQELAQLYNNATNVIYGLAVTNATLQADLTYANETIDELQAHLAEIEPNPFRLLAATTIPRTRAYTHTLPDGRVVIQGGTILDLPSQRVISVFNPQTEQIFVGATNIDIRIGHMGNVLPDGRVMFSGGSIRYFPSGPDVFTNSTEIYNPGTSNVVYGPSMIQPRMAGFSINLADGRLLMMGGRNLATPFLAQSEIYEPSNQVFRLSGVMTAQVLTPIATLLQDERVFIYGYGTNQLPVAQIFDPVTETFSSVSGSSIARSSHQASLLANGRVFISGGRSPSTGATHSTTEIFDPATGTFTAGPTMSNGRFNFTSTTLADGKVLIAGGQTNISSSAPALTLAEIYDPVTGSFSSAGVMATNQFGHAATLLDNGAVLFTGGSTGIPSSFLNRVQLYDPNTHVRTSVVGNLNLLIDDLEAENDDLLAQLSSVQQQLNIATNTITGLTITNASLQAALANANTTIAGLVVTNAQLQADLDSCHAEKAVLIGQINTLTNQIAQLQGTISTLTAQNSALANQVTQQQATINSLTGQVNSLTNQVAQQQVTINTLTAQNNALTNQVAQLQATIGSLQAQNNALTNQVATLTQQNTQLQTALTAEQAQNATLTAQVAQQAALIASLQSQNSTLTNQVATLTAQNAALQTALTTTQGHVQTLVTAFQGEFNNPTFVIPGTTLEQQVQNLINAILGLNHGQQQALYGQLD